MSPATFSRSERRRSARREASGVESTKPGLAYPRHRHRLAAPAHHGYASVNGQRGSGRVRGVCDPLRGTTPYHARAAQPGRFTFPSPYNTTGVRLTNGGDCGGKDSCSSRLLVLAEHEQSRRQQHDADLSHAGPARGGQGPTLFRYNKTTDQVQVVGPLFAAASAELGVGRRLVLERDEAEQALRQPGCRLLPVRRRRAQFETVFDAAPRSAATRTSGRCTRAATTACTRRRSSRAPTTRRSAASCTRRRARSSPGSPPRATTTSARSTRAAAGSSSRRTWTAPPARTTSSSTLSGGAERCSTRRARRALGQRLRLHGRRGQLEQRYRAP